MSTLNMFQATSSWFDFTALQLKASSLTPILPSFPTLLCDLLNIKANVSFTLKIAPYGPNFLTSDQLGWQMGHKWGSPILSY